MSKHIGVFFSVSLFSLCVHAQWSRTDSLDLNQFLMKEGEIKLNRNPVNDIDFGTFIGAPKAVDEKSSLKFDVTLPDVLLEKIKPALTLYPYKATTRYDYDPIYRKKIYIKADTWKHGDNFHLEVPLVYSNWAKSPFDPGIRKSVEEIEATGLRYNPLAKPNSRTTGAWESAGGSGIASGDLMAVFTKEFWDKKGRKRKERTLEVLRHYGDSTTVLVNEELKKAVVR